MLERLSIDNIALLHKETLEFKSGLNVLTGETGAGKSLIIDSLQLLLGEKADKSLISRGEKVATVEAVFTDLSKQTKDIMQELGLEEDDTLIISRKLSIEGKNEIRVNGVSFTLSMLKKLSAPIMDLHGQFEHQNLLKVSSHISILDTYGGEKLEKVKQAYVKTLQKYNEIVKEMDSYLSDDVERARLIELYGYQIEEIDNAGFYEGEEEELKNYRNQVLHQEKILEVLNGAVKLASGDGYEYNGSLENLKKIIVMLSGISNFYPEINEVVERLESLKIELEDISENLEDKINNMYFDEQKAQENEKRLDLLSSFKKKYGYDIATINEYREKIGKEYDRLVGSYERIQQLKQEEKIVREELVKKAEALSLARKAISVDFEKDIKKELSDLGMKNSTFVVDITPLGLENRTVNGFDRVEFLFSANLGEPAKPIKAVASGGEMSRFMLAVKNVTAQIEGVGTLVFDEIDTGVSGHIALALAEKLRRVSEMAQVICVTHLAQIASYGNNHLFIEKSESDGRTKTEVHELSREQRVQEIARLLSGNITNQTLLSAQEMLESGENFNKILK